MEAQFTDDLAPYTSNMDNLEAVTTEFVRRKEKWGPIGSVSKTKGMAFGEGLGVADTAPLQPTMGRFNGE